MAPLWRRQQMWRGGSSPKYPTPLLQQQLLELLLLLLFVVVVGGGNGEATTKFHAIFTNGAVLAARLAVVSFGRGIYFWACRACASVHALTVVLKHSVEV
jgi:hypothetical protein